MSDKQLSAGDHITSKCTKCKNITNHTIVAMVGEKVARVECNTCGSVHNYRKAVVKKATTKSKKSSNKSVKINKVKAQWETLLDNADPTNAIPYSMQTLIKNGDLIQHPSFGLGRVISTTRPNKMEVFFQSGIKLMRCSLAGY
jgi:Zn ribbon nucleic-acid-binding protein